MNKLTTPIILAASVLHQALTGLGRVLRHKSTLPVLSTVRLIRHRGAVTLTATDLDLHLSYTHRTEPEPLTELARAMAEMRWAREPAEGICVPASALRQAAKGKGDVTILEGKLLFGGTTLPFDPIPADEFPGLVGHAPFAPVCTLDGPSRAALLHGLDFTSTDCTRYVINGVLLEGKPAKPSSPPPHVVATDGRRLYAHPLPGLAALPEPVIVPNAALAALGSPGLIAHDWTLLYTPGKGGTAPPSATDIKHYEKAHAHWAGQPEKARKLVQEPHKPKPGTWDPTPLLRVVAGKWELTTRLIEGNFPNWRQVVPNFTDPITVSFTEEQAKQFQSVLAKWPQCKAQDDAVYLAFPGTGIRITDKAGAVHLLPGPVSTHPLGIAADRRYLADAVTFGACTLRMFSAGDPLLFTSGKTFVVVMPMKGTPVPVEDPEMKAAEKQWKDCIVRIKNDPKFLGGKVVAFTRKGSKIVAEVSDGKKAVIHDMPLTNLELHDRPAKAA